MKLAVVDKKEYASSNLKLRIRGIGIKTRKKNPDFVISHGGDGTLLISERAYPGIPKAIVKDSSVCRCCDYELTPDKLVEKLKQENYRIEEHIKIESCGLKAVNDIVIRNLNQGEAIRFNVYIDKKKIAENIIGDGIIVSTSFGSTAYFHAVTKSCFKKGKLGIAFNNSTIKVDPIIVSNNSIIEFELLRGEATLSADNDRRITRIHTKEKIKINKAKERFKLIKFHNGKSNEQ